MQDDYYVYALKDPRTNPAKPFYIGKGVGTRSYDHLVRPDDSEKGKRIKAIIASGCSPLVSRLVDRLTESAALKLEAELIAAFGTIATGGLLTNAIIPSGLEKKNFPSITLPEGVRERAQLGLELVKDAILELAKANPKGITNSETASLLGLRSDYGGGSKDYLSYSVIGILMREGKLARQTTSRRHIAKII